MLSRIRERSFLPLVAALVAAGLALVPGAASPSTAVAPAVAAAAPPPALLGTSAENAAGSCWEIKQRRSTAPSGAYWLVTPLMREPQRFYCDQTTDGGGWLLIGKGRNAWVDDDTGTGDPAALLSPAYAGSTDTHQYPTALVNALLNGGRPQDLTEGLRLRRALDPRGLSWQDVRFKPDFKQTGWSWAFGARFPLISWKFTPGALGVPTSGTGWFTNDFGTGSATTRVRTNPAEATGWTKGWAYGESVVGTSAPDSYLWTPTDGGPMPVPVAQLYIRPRVVSTDIGFQPLPAGGTAKVERRALFESDADPLPWGVSGIAGATAREGSLEVQELVESNGRMYVGGNFRYVQRDGGGTGQVEQAFLAAFDVTTGAWISSFRPDLDEQVRALEVLPNGSIVAAGDFTRANGSPATAIVALDPVTGATDPTFALTVENRVTGGTLRIWDLDRLGDQLYLGGNFTHLKGGARSSYSFMRNVARVQAADGTTADGWNPDLNGGVMEIDPSDDGTRVYAAGFFTKSKTTAAKSAAAILTTFVTRADGTVQHLAEPTWSPAWSDPVANYQQAILEAGGKVWVGGAQHSLFGFDRATFQSRTSAILHEKGDVQMLAAAHGVVYAGSHANNQFAYTGATAWSGSDGASQDWTSAHTQHWIGAYDLATGEALADFAPELNMRGGVWGMVVDSNGRLWAGGDMDAVRTKAQPGRWAGGFTRYSLRDTTAPPTPSRFRVTAVGAASITLAWNGVSDPSGSHYQVLMDDRPVAATQDTTITVPITDPSVVHRFFLRATDEVGNLSASTSALNGVMPVDQPPTAAFDVTTDELTITADGSGSSDEEGPIVGYAWAFGDGGTATGATATHTYAAPGTYDVTLTVTDSAGHTSSATRSVTVDNIAAINLVARDATWSWRYVAGDPGAGWATTSYDDSGWRQAGTAPLGFAPAASAGQVTTNIDSYATTSERPITAYFRKTIQIADPAKLSDIVLTSVADDGAVFYVNGVEVARQNMRDGTVTYATFAPSARRYSVAMQTPVVVSIPSSMLVAGTNVIAAESHVNYRATADLTFHLTMDAMYAP